MSVTSENQDKKRIFDAAAVIISRQNPIVSAAAKLSDKKHRDEAGLFLVDGIKLIEEALASGLAVEYILLTERAAEKYSHALISAVGRTRVYILSEPAFSRVTDERAPEGVVAAVRYSDSVRRRYVSADACEDYGGLILDGVQNPENFGAILRSARAFGMGNIICGDGCADIYGRRVMRSSMGAALHVGTLFAGSAADVCRELAANGHRVIAAVPRDDADDLSDFEFRSGDFVVIGNEGHGVSHEVMDAATGCLYIPMAEGQESLNAACAASIILWEMYRNVR